jgi:hypothetical protein
MRLDEISEIQSGYIARSKIEAFADGPCHLLQAKDVDADRLDYRTDGMIRFRPSMSRKDWILKSGDVLFMARGVRNYSILIHNIPDPTLAASCFFVIRADQGVALPAYLCWYLNQEPAQQYIMQYSGRGVHMPVVRRAVLESVDIPIVPCGQQKKIAVLDNLMTGEQLLFRQLGQKRKEFITAVCLSVTQRC